MPDDQQYLLMFVLNTYASVCGHPYEALPLSQALA